jgi:hypothetical protein
MLDVENNGNLNMLQFYCDELNMHTGRARSECDDADSLLRFLCSYKIIKADDDNELFEIAVILNEEDFEVVFKLCSSDFVMRWIENQIEFVLLMEEKL